MRTAARPIAGGGNGPAVAWGRAAPPRDVQDVRTARRADGAPRGRVAPGGRRVVTISRLVRNGRLARCNDGRRVVVESGRLARRTGRAPGCRSRCCSRPTHVRSKSIRTSEGWIVRRWVEGRLSAELFYGAMPSAAEWSSTMATLGVSDADSQAGWRLMRQRSPVHRCPKPWPERVEQARCAGHRCAPLDLRRLMLAAGAALVVATLVLGVISIRQWYVEGLLDRSLAEAKERLAPVAEQRSLAFDVVQRLQAWNELDRYPAPLELIDAFAESVPRRGRRFGTQARRWRACARPCRTRAFNRRRTW